MKKLVFAFLLIFLLSISFSMPKYANADSQSPSTELQTEIAIPKSYLEYFKLNKPLDIWTNGTEFVIAETNRIAYYNGSEFKTYNLHSQSVSEVFKKGNFILFLSSSRIYSIDVISSTISDTGIISASDFDVFENTLVTNPSGEIHFYYITDCINTFSADELVSAKISLAYTPNSLCLISPDTLYYMHEESLIKASQAVSTTVADNITNARSISFGGGFIFVSTAEGIYKLNATTNSQISYIKASLTNDLNNLGDPRGIFYDSNFLYIADNFHNAITKLNVTSDIFSDFKITAESGAVDRISQDVSAICATESSIYIVDKNAIKAIDSNSNISEISLKGFYDTKLIATNGTTFLLSSGSNLNLVKQEAGEFKQIEIIADLSTLHNITALCTFENDYYVLNNEMINNAQTAVIYRLSTTNNTLTKHSEIAGRGYALSCDVFGDIYVEIYNESQGKYYVYANDISNSKHKLIHSGTEKLICFYADYEGNLFSLTESNTIICTSGASDTIFTLKISQSLPQSLIPIGFATSQNRSKAYILYNGFVLTISSDSLGIATPKKIKVPQDFSINFNETPEFVKIKNGAKLFEVSLSADGNFGEYFNYESMSANSESSTYFLITRTQQYALIANSNRSAIVRSEDIISDTLTFDETQKQMWTVNNCNVYSYPQISEYTKGIALSKNTSVTVKKSFQLNGVNFCLIEQNGIKGYVAQSMLKDGIAFVLSPKNFKSYTLTASTTVYLDKDLTNQSFTLEKGSIVNVIENNGEVAKIVTFDGEYYINFSALKPKSDTVIRNIILISLLAIAIFSTSIYIMTRIFGSKKVSNGY